MKYSKANTVNTQLFIARYGKAARYPVHQAALGLLLVDAELKRLKKEIEDLSKILSDAKRQKKQAYELLEAFYKDGEKNKRKQSELPTSCRKSTIL